MMSLVTVVTKRYPNGHRKHAHGHVSADNVTSLCGREVSVVQSNPPDAVRNINCTVCLRAMRKAQGAR